MRYTDQELIDTAKRFKTRNEWKAFDGNKQYQVAKLRPGVLAKCTDHMVDQRTVLTAKVYTDEEIIDVAKTYKSSTEWKHSNVVVYRHACRRGLLERCTAHMEHRGGIYDGIYVVYVYEFSDKHSYVGLTCSPERRFKSHAEGGLVFDHAQQTGLKPELKILEEKLSSPYAAGDAERRWIAHYEQNGWTKLNTADGGSIGNIAVKKWNKKNVMESALKYKTKSEWYLGDHRAYAAAKSSGWFKEATAHMIPQFRITPEHIREVAARYTDLDKFTSENPSLKTVASRLGIYHEVTAHMPRKIVKGRIKARPKVYRFKWTYELCKQDAKRFKTRTEWARGNQSAYHAARRMGVLNDFFAYSYGSPAFYFPPSHKISLSTPSGSPEPVQERVVAPVAAPQTVCQPIAVLPPV